MSGGQKMEKALEALHTDASGVPGPDPASGKIWLNAGDVVNRIVRDFVGDVLRDFRSPGFMDKLAFECLRMNGLFLGDAQADTYLKGPWNRPDQLGEYLQINLGINGETRFAVRDAFMVFARDVLKMAAQSGGEFNEASKNDLDERIRVLRDALIGVSELSAG